MAASLKCCARTPHRRSIWSTGRCAHTASPNRDGDRLLHGLRKDLSALRERVTGTLAAAPSTRSNNGSRPFRVNVTRDEHGRDRPPDRLAGERIGERPIDRVSASSRRRYAAGGPHDKTAKAFGLAKSIRPSRHTVPRRISTHGDMVATRTARRATQPRRPTAPLRSPSKVSRAIAMLQSMQHEPKIDAFDEVQDKIGEVNER